MIDRPDKKAGFCSCSAAFSDRASAKTHTNTKNTEMKTTTKIKTKIKIKNSPYEDISRKDTFSGPLLLSPWQDHLPLKRGCSEGFLNSELFSNPNEPNMGRGQKTYFPLFSSGGEVWHLLLLLLPSVSEEDLLPSPISAHLYHIHLFCLHHYLIQTNPVLPFSFLTQNQITLDCLSASIEVCRRLFSRSGFCPLTEDSELNLAVNWFLCWPRCLCYLPLVSEWLQSQPNCTS